MVFIAGQFNRSSVNRDQWHGKRDDCIVHKIVLIFVSTKDQGLRAGGDVPWTESKTNIRRIRSEQNLVQAFPFADAIFTPWHTIEASCCIEVEVILIDFIFQLKKIFHFLYHHGAPD